jgi:hypothetical protein
VTFDDVAGIDEAERELAEVVDFLKRPARYRKLGARIPLFAEEYDVETGRHLGNFPRAFSHLALVEAAARLVVAEGLAEVAG